MEGISIEHLGPFVYVGSAVANGSNLGDILRTIGIQSAAKLLPWAKSERGILGDHRK